MTAIDTAEYRRITDNGDHCQDMIYDLCAEVDRLRSESARLEDERRHAVEVFGRMKVSRDNLVELVKTYACTVRQLGILGRPKFAVFDEDGEILTEADTVEDAAELAIRFIENRE